MVEIAMKKLMFFFIITTMTAMSFLFILLNSIKKYMYSLFNFIKIIIVLYLNSEVFNNRKNIFVNFFKIIISNFRSLKYLYLEYVDNI